MPISVIIRSATMTIMFIYCMFLNSVYGQFREINIDFKQIPHEYKLDGVLPKVSEQILFYYNEADAWLEFTNYEFLINGEESNRLVTIFIGKSAKEVANINKKDFIKKHIKILDPESAFVFQEAILKYWHQASIKNIKSLSLINLAQAIQAGYNALEYHFGFTNVLFSVDEITNSIYSPENLLSFLNSHQETYKKNAQSLHRFVSDEDIDSKTNLGFAAYYPNPIYLHNIVRGVRAQNTKYNDHRLFSQPKLAFPLDNPGFLLKQDTSKEYNEYYDILKRVYPEPISTESYPKNIIGNYKYSNFKSLDYKKFKPLPPIYLFRGDGRSLEEVAKANGFDSPLARGRQSSSYGYGGAYSNKILEKLLAEHKINYQAIKANDQQEIDKVKTIDDFWKIDEGNDLMLYTNKAYVSASRNINTAKNSGNVYIVFTKKGIDIPIFFEKANDLNGCHYETIIPLQVKFEEVCGVIATDSSKFLVGPIFLKLDLETQDKHNFWQIIQIAGGKPHVSLSRQ